MLTRSASHQHGQSIQPNRTLETPEDSPAGAPTQLVVFTPQSHLLKTESRGVALVQLLAPSNAPSVLSAQWPILMVSHRFDTFFHEFPQRSNLLVAPMSAKLNEMPCRALKIDQTPLMRVQEQWRSGLRSRLPPLSQAIL